MSFPRARGKGDTLNRPNDVVVLNGLAESHINHLIRRTHLRADDMEQRESVACG